LHRGPMDAGQRALAASFALSDRLLLAGLGPAGAGKTTAMRLVARAVDAAGGRLIPLAPSLRAAKVLGDDLELRSHTLHSWPPPQRAPRGPAMPQRSRPSPTR
ncbi:AAA family ATPase, partial [Streptomyces sp. NPDC001156]